MIRFIVFTLSRLDAQARSITGNVGSAAGFPAGDEFNFGPSHQEWRRLPSGVLVPRRAAVDFPVPIFVRRIEGNTQLYCFAAGGFASGISGAVARGGKWETGVLMPPHSRRPIVWSLCQVRPACIPTATPAFFASAC